MEGGTGPFYTYKEKNADCSATEGEGRVKKKFHLQIQRILFTYEADQSTIYWAPCHQIEPPLFLDYDSAWLCGKLHVPGVFAHWLKNMVTIHPIVIHYMIPDKPGIYHKSFIYLSPLNRHNGTMVFAMLKLFYKRDFLPEVCVCSTLSTIEQTVPLPSIRTVSSFGSSSTM